MEAAMVNRFLASAEDWDAESHERGDAFQAAGLDMLSTMTRLRVALDRAREQAATHEPATANIEASSASAEQVRGLLSERFESGLDGSAAIGWDRMGGTSYGRFQLSSRQGSMDDFIAFLEQEVPQWAQRLKDAGATDTGSRNGAMPETWKTLATENPDLLAGLEHRFIHASHYLPAAKAVAETLGLDMNAFPEGLRETLFSTAVQHGPTGAANIFGRAMGELGENTGGDNIDMAGLIDLVYGLRAERFGGSTERVREAVQNRLSTERQLAQALLAGQDIFDSA